MSNENFIFEKLKEDWEMKNPNRAPRIQTDKVKFFKLLGKIIELMSIATHEIKAPKKTEKFTNPTQDLIIVPHPSLKLHDPLKTKFR